MARIPTPHLGEVPVCPEHRRGIAELQCQHKLQPGYGVQQPAFQQFATARGIRQILMQEQQIITEVKIGLARV